MRRTARAASRRDAGDVAGEAGEAGEAASLQYSALSERVAQSERSAYPERSARPKRRRSEEPLPVRVRRAAMDALARREHSFAELKRKLQQKFSEQLAFSSLRETAVPDVRPIDAQPSSLDTLATGFSSVVQLESNSESRAETSSEPNLDPNSDRTRQVHNSKFSEETEASEAAGLAELLYSETAISEEGLSELIDEQLSRLRDEGLQSDARFTESFVRYRKTRGFAYQHIKADLLGRGVRGDLIEESLLIDDPDWADMAEALVTKRLAGVSDRQFGGKTHRKLVRFLESRGYPRAIIRAVLDSKFSQSSRRTT